MLGVLEQAPGKRALLESRSSGALHELFEFLGMAFFNMVFDRDHDRAFVQIDFARRLRPLDWADGREILFEMAFDVVLANGD